MTEAMPFLQKYDITFLRPPTIRTGRSLGCGGGTGDTLYSAAWVRPESPSPG